MDEILRLSTALAEQMLEAQVMGQPIPTQKFTALVGAARFLKDNNMAWPPLVEEVVHEIGKRMAAAKSALLDEDAEGSPRHSEAAGSS
ncbi:hypothetical protein [Methylobacterium sp.]|uniref:hypothetical protein n=1 Tax=Methylobacterium sp. TaxID=409 RepID=UPI003B005D46